MARPSATPAAAARAFEGFFYGGPGYDGSAFGAGRDELLRGNGGDDELYGDYSHGGFSPDDPFTLDGGAAGGDDRLEGGTGDDRLYGDAVVHRDGSRGGDDRLYGGSGDDRLYGDGAVMEDGALGGDDVLTGGRGADLFFFAGDFGRDRVTDYRAGQGDRLAIAGHAAEDVEVEAHAKYTVVTVGENEVFVRGGAVGLDDIDFV